MRNYRVGVAGYPQQIQKVVIYYRGNRQRIDWYELNKDKLGSTELYDPSKHTRTIINWDSGTYAVDPWPVPKAPAATDGGSLHVTATNTYKTIAGHKAHLYLYTFELGTTLVKEQAWMATDIPAQYFVGDTSALPQLDQVKGLVLEESGSASQGVSVGGLVTLSISASPITESKFAIPRGLKRMEPSKEPNNASGAS